MGNSKIVKGYHVLVDDNFHYMDERYRESAGFFENYVSALVVALRITVESIEQNEADTGEQTWRNYQNFGKDPFILPVGGAPPPEENYSAWDIAKTHAEAMEYMRREHSEVGSSETRQGHGLGGT